METKERIKADVIDTLKTIYDPEIPVNIYELGMIYTAEVDDEGNVKIRMTLTTPACPVAGSLPGQVKERIEQVYGVKSVDLELVWDPPWSMDMMSEEAKLTLGYL